jgi:hypothetical protein
MHYQVTINDPNVYARPWTMAFPLRRNNERGFRLLEEACHEGERNTDPLIALGYKIYRYECGWAMTRATLRSV